MICVIVQYEFVSILLTIAAIITPIVIHIKECGAKDKEYRKSCQRQARNFIIDNDDIYEYMPLCIVAALNKNRRFYRPLYKEFSKLSIDIQKEVIKQCNCRINLTASVEWVRESLDDVIEYIRLNGIFAEENNWVYDMRKYFYMALEYYPTEEYDNRLIDRKYKDYFTVNSMFLGGTIDFCTYCNEYVRCIISQKDSLIISSNPPRPIEYLERVENLKTVGDKDICYWALCIIEVFSEILINMNGNKDIEDDYKTDIQIQTFEDKFYNVCLVLLRLHQLKVREC